MLETVVPWTTVFSYNTGKDLFSKIYINYSDHL